MYLQKNNLTLRKATLADVSQLCQWWADGTIMAHAGFPKGIQTDPTELSLKIASNHSHVRLIIEIDELPVGEMSYHIEQQTAEIGIKICDFSYQEKGYGTVALNLLIHYLFQELKMNRIILDTNLTNTRAQHVYEKLKFKKVSVRYDSWTDQLGELQSAVDYELLKEDFFN